jgi:feruloyl esterase
MADPPQKPLDCATIGSWSSDGVRVDSAEAVAASEELPVHCKVAGTIGTEVHFELLLPVHEDWNSRFVMGGGGGFVGSVQNMAMAPLPRGNALERGFATVGTDTGHTGTGIDASWALENEEREIDFGYRAVHRTTEVAKAIIQDYYAREIDNSYFIGCSRGGGQAMIEAQRFPDDYHGIVAMAPAYSWPRLAAGLLQNEQKVYPDASDLSSPVITAENRALLEREILGRCDASDGVKDGFLNDPRLCDFDPAELLCEGSPSADCLTAPQLEAVRTIYSGPTIDGAKVFAGFPFGSENELGGWDRWITGGENATAPGVPNLQWAFGTEIYKYLILDDPDFDYTSYDFANWHSDVAVTDERLSAIDTDLMDLRDAGGKLLFWHGWSDPALTALGMIDYYEAVEAADPDVRDYSRLFLAPGVLHCAGGPGPDRVDLLSAIVDWVEQGIAPERLVASKLDSAGATVMTRPLCPYPEIAVYNGEADANDASSFRCSAAK